jgi:plasmid stability protein
MVALQNHGGGYVPNLSIKNVPEPMMERLRARAKQHYRSLQGELMAILVEALPPKRLTLEELVQRVQERDVRTSDESVSMVREDRDAR